MKAWHISDTHMNHSQLVVPEGVDIVIHTGDSTNYRDPFRNEPEMRAFIDWFATLPIPNKVMVAGNHDTSIEKGLIRADFIESRGISYLYCEERLLLSPGVGTEAEPVGGAGRESADGGAEIGPARSALKKGGLKAFRECAVVAEGAAAAGRVQADAFRIGEGPSGDGTAIACGVTRPVGVGIAFEAGIGDALGREAGHQHQPGAESEREGGQKGLHHGYCGLWMLSTAKWGEPCAPILPRMNCNGQQGQGFPSPTVNAEAMGTPSSGAVSPCGRSLH
jgi:hypothetical protein